MAQTHHDEHRSRAHTIVEEKRDEPISPPTPAEDASKLDEKKSVRLRELRAERDNERTPELSEKDHAELQRLSAEESKLAGHVVEPPATRHMDPHTRETYDLLELIQRMVDKLPALADMQPSVTQMRNNLDAAHEKKHGKEDDKK